MSELKVNKVTPRSGTTVTLGDSGDTITIPSGATITNSGTATGFNPSGTITIDNIQFPATQVASADANNLDDYEEGTFTPNVGGTATYAYQHGVYTKIGNVVYVSIGLAITTIGTGSVNVISGLPFTCRSTLSAPTLAVNYFDNLNTSLTFLVGAVNQNDTTIAFRSTAGTSINMTIAPSIFKTPSTVLLSGCYDI